MLTKLHRLSAARILLVDDDIVSRHVISACLNAVGFRNIETADDGRDALDKTYGHKPAMKLLKRHCKIMETMIGLPGMASS